MTWYEESEREREKDLVEPLPAVEPLPVSPQATTIWDRWEHDDDTHNAFFNKHQSLRFFLDTFDFSLYFIKHPDILFFVHGYIHVHY